MRKFQSHKNPANSRYHFSDDYKVHCYIRKRFGGKKQPARFCAAANDQERIIARVLITANVL